MIGGLGRKRSAPPWSPLMWVKIQFSGPQHVLERKQRRIASQPSPQDILKFRPNILLPNIWPFCSELTKLAANLLTQRENSRSQRRPCFDGEEDWDADLPPKAAALIQRAVSREILCPVCHDCSGEGSHTPHCTVTRVTRRSVTCLLHQTNPIIRKMLPCSVAETDRKPVRTGTSRAGIQKQNALIGKRENKSMVGQSWLLS